MHLPKLALVASFCATTVFAADTNWQPLFNGKDLTGWDSYMNKPHPSWEVPGMTRGTNGLYTEVIGKNRDPLHVFTVATVDGAPAIHVSGQGFGTITTIGSYTNFHLRLQTKWGENRWGNRTNSVRDCGLLYYAHGDNLGADSQTWPRSIEFQIQEHDMGDLYAISSQITVPTTPRGATNGRTNYLYDPKGTPRPFQPKGPFGNRSIRLTDAEKPRGEWNTIELICFNGNSIHIVNGQVVMRLQNAKRLDGPEPAPLASGRISLQTEGAEVYYRNVELQPITEIPKEFRE